MSRDTRIVALCLAGLALMIIGSATLVTILIAHGATEWLRLPFRMMCHGIARRCLVIAGTPMPLCARCVGIYGGFLAGLVLFPFVPLNERVMKVVLFAAAFPLFFDGVTQAIGLRESTNPLRLATGLAAGAAFGLWALTSIETRARQRFAPS